jgi:transposase-like protein
VSKAPHRLRALVEHAVAASEPGVALRAITALREEVDAFERLQVARALDEGESFAAVARALGISRQAAHRRYRDLADAEPAPPSIQGDGEGRMLVTSEARTAVAQAREEASALGAGVVGSEHLLLGILRCESSPAAQLLRDRGITIDEARACAQPTLVDGDASPEPVPVAPGPRGISAYARVVFEQSLREAVRRGDGYIGVDHLLLAAIQDPRGGACRTLESLGADVGMLRRRLSRES